MTMVLANEKYVFRLERHLFGPISFGEKQTLGQATQMEDSTAVARWLWQTPADLSVIGKYTVN